MYDNRNISKSISLIVAVMVLAGALVYVPDWSVIGVFRGCTLIARFGYSFFHSSILHAFVNVWCLLGIAFLYEVSLWRLLFAYMIALFVPDIALSDIPTVGLSCICYALLGSLSFEVRRKLYFQICMVIYIAVGFLFPAVNVAIHVYGYIAGLIVALLNYSLSCLRK
ncbi:MAG: rhomboid family intramembrane serine protease [Muribaculaceae bacterium]